MIKRIAALALTGFTLLGVASSAWAHHPTRQAYDEQELNLLVKAVKTTGHQIYLDSPACIENKGLFGAATYDQKLLVCVDNHKGDQAELADTVRHEAIHLVQYCKGRNNGATMANLVPEKAEEYLEEAVKDLHMPLVKYRDSQYYREAEARVLAHYLNEDTVAYLLEEYCNNGKKD